MDARARILPFSRLLGRPAPDTGWSVHWVRDVRVLGLEDGDDDLPPDPDPRRDVIERLDEGDLPGYRACCRLAADLVPYCLRRHGPGAIVVFNPRGRLVGSVPAGPSAAAA